MNRYVTWSMLRPTFKICDLATATSIPHRKIRTTLQLIDMEIHDSDLFGEECLWHRMYSYWECVQLMQTTLCGMSGIFSYLEFSALLDTASMAVQEESYFSHILTEQELERRILTEIEHEYKNVEPAIRQALEDFAAIAATTFCHLDNFIQAEIGSSPMKIKCQYALNLQAQTDSDDDPRILKSSRISTYGYPNS